MKPMTQIDLDITMAQGCSNPDCKEPHDHIMYIHAACHLEAALSVCYDSKRKLLIIECIECRLPVAIIKPAEP